MLPFYVQELRVGACSSVPQFCPTTTFHGPKLHLHSWAFLHQVSLQYVQTIRTSALACNGDVEYLPASKAVSMSAIASAVYDPLNRAYTPAAYCTCLLKPRNEGGKQHGLCCRTPQGGLQGRRGRTWHIGSIWSNHLRACRPESSHARGRHDLNTCSTTFVRCYSCKRRYIAVLSLP